jgi:peptidoglycan DL-endopeptidase LytE
LWCWPLDAGPISPDMRDLARRLTRAIGTIAVIAGAAAGCATTGTARPSPFPGAPAPPSSAPVTRRPAEPREPAREPGKINPGAAAPVASSLPETSSGILQTALGLRGIPYREAGTDPQSGFDCSGFVQYVFRQHHVSLPRTVAEQFVIGHRIPVPDLVAGDLVFFPTVRPGASHVGIALGDGTFVHARVSGGVIRIDRLNTPYWQSRVIGGTRVPSADVR